MIPMVAPNRPLLLLVDDQPANLRLLAEILRDDYGITTTTRGAEVLDLARSEPQPDLILLDVMMPDMNGLEVLRRLRANTQTSDIPVLFVSADATELTQHTGLEEGADDYVVKPIQPLVLFTRIRNLLRRKQAEAALRKSEARFRSYFELPLAGRAITSPSTGWIDVNATLCAMLGYSKAELLQMTWAELTHPDDLVADWAQFQRVMAGEIDGYTLEKRFIRKDGRIVVVELAVQCLRCPDRSVDYFVALIQDITERKQYEEKIAALAFSDPLTGLPNRRLLLDRLVYAQQNSKHYNSHGAVLLLDLNRFKQLNDTHGHNAGDQWLVEVARRLTQVTRDIDTVARIGGDEFVVLLESLGPEVSKAATNAVRVAEKIRRVLTEICLIGEIQHYGSASIGIALFLGDEIDHNQILRRADVAMYEDKKGGL
ncbi:MAG: diguanylate cyclase domain-containing protein [Candidatus Competibacteraceae bacterium]